jgi:hypothetical protein
MYLAKAPEAPQRAQLLAKIAELQTLVDEQKAAPGVPAAPPRLPSASAQVAPPPPRPLRAPPKVMPPGWSKKIAGVVVGGAGLGLLGGGMAVGVEAQQAADELTRAGSRGQFDYATQQAGKRDQMLEGVLLGIGVAATASGVVLYVLGSGDARAAKQEKRSRF